MTAFFQWILSGLSISFAGTLPLGNLNVTAMHIAAKETYKNALLFASGVVIIEMLYLRIALEAMGWVISHHYLFRSLQWIAVIFLLILALGSFIGLAKKNQRPRNIIIDNKINRFMLGLMMSAVNPMQFPFWAGWSAYLLSREWLEGNSLAFNIFTLSAGAGTVIALLLFITTGKKLSAFMERHQKGTQAVLGVLFLIMALYQAMHIYMASS